MDRRDFLSVAAAVTGGSMISSHALAANNSPILGVDPSLNVPSSAWNQLKAGLKGFLVRPGETGFLALARPNNLRYKNILPRGIAVCEDASDVSLCIRWAEKHDVPLITRGGGHSYAGYSCTHGLMINLKNINKCDFDTGTNTVTVGGGIRNGVIYRALDNVGRSITHGRCPTVGAGGFLLGGGIGFDMRRNGFGSDKLIRTELVLANGDIVVADSNTNPGLFWACRGGGGGNFGVSTSFTLETFPVDHCIEFSLTWTNASDQLLETLFLHFENAPIELGSKITLSPERFPVGASSSIEVELIGQFIGSMDTLNQVLAPVFALKKPSRSVIKEVPYWNASDFLSEAGGPGYYQERSRFMNTPMTSGLMQKIRKWLPRWSQASGTGLIKFFQTGGNTQSLAPNETAFVHRRSVWLASIEIAWSEKTLPINLFIAHRWQNDFYREIIPLCGGGAFQNFPDPSLRDWAEAYYGENLERLQRIKTEADPLNVFHFRQSIPPIA